MVTNHFTCSPLLEPEKLAKDWVEWVSQWDWDLFVTLTFNQAPASSPRRLDAQIINSKAKLKAWDARLQSTLIGRDWAKSHDYRMYCCYILEKPRVNLHWHGLVKFFNAHGVEHQRQVDTFMKRADPVWRRLVPSGNVDIKSVFDETGAARYASKSLTDVLNYDHWVPPDSFWRP